MLSSPGAIRRKQSLFVWAVIAVTYVMVWLIPLFTSYHGSGDGTEYATRILRDPTQFKWYVIPLFIIVVNAYVEELRKKNYSGVLAGLAFFLMDAFNEPESRANVSADGWGKQICQKATKKYLFGRLKSRDQDIQVMLCPSKWYN